MAEVLRWKLVLEDGFSKPSRAAAASIREYERALTRAAAADARRQAAILRTQQRSQAQQARVRGQSIARAERESNRYLQGLARQNAAAYRRDERMFVANLARQDRARARAEATFARTSARTARLNERWRDSILGSVGDGIASIGRIGLGVAATVGGISLGFAGVAASILRATLQLIAFREGAVTTMAVMLGGANGPDRAGGEAAFLRAQAIARRTPLDNRQVVQAQQQTLTAGFRGREANAVLAASTDVGAAMQATDPTAQSRYVRALGQIRGRGTLQAEELNQLGDVGVNRDAVFRSIGQQMGLTETGTALNARVQDMMRRKQISGDIGVRAALEATRTTISGGQLGGLATRLGGTLGGSLSNLASAAETFVTSIMALENLPGVRALADVVAQIGDTLGGANETGRRFQAIFAGILNEVGLAVGRVNFAKLFVQVADTIERAQSAFAKAWPTIRAVVTSFGSGFLEGAGESFRSISEAMAGFSSGSGASTAETARTIGFAFGAVGESIAMTISFTRASIELFTQLYETMRAFYGFLYDTLVPGFFGIGPAISTGLAQGIRDSWATVTSTVTELASGLPGPVRTALGIASPSKVFAELGAYTAQGFAVGIDRGVPQIESAVGSMVAAPSLGGVGGRAAPSVSIGQLVVPIHGGATNAETAATVRAAIEEVFVDLFERMALTGGALGAPA